MNFHPLFLHADLSKGRTIRKVMGGGGKNQKKNLFPEKN
jgi:hypothetical protein